MKHYIYAIWIWFLAGMLHSQEHPFRGVVSNGGPSKKLTYNLGHNILELHNVLAQTRFTTSKTKRDI